MRVCIVNTFHYRRGGDSTYALDLSDLLESKGHQVVHFAMKHLSNIPSRWEAYFAENIDFSEIFRQRGLLRKVKALIRSLYSTDARNRFAKLLDDTQPDIVHLNNFRRHLTFSVVEEAHMRGIPIVFTAHDYDPICPNSLLLANGRICEACKNFRYYKAILRRCKEKSLLGTAAIVLEGYFVLVRKFYEMIDLIIAPSEFLRRKLIEFGFDARKIVHLPNFVNPENFSPSFKGDGFIYFGRLAPEKGIESLIRAASALSDIKLTIAGDGPLKEEALSLITALACDNVRLTGRLGKEQLSEEIRKSMAVVLPSLCYENFPYAVLEAFAYGKPVIATRIGGISEIVTHGENGLLVEPGDWADLKKSMDYLHNHPQIAEKMGMAARKTVETRYCSDLHYDRLMEVYKNASRRDRL